MNIEKIKQKTVVHQVMEEIKKLIASGEYRVGDRLPTEQQLADMFGIGRTTIREAIKVFHHLGVLESKTAKGTFVCNSNNITTEALTWAILLGKNDFYELLELRLVMEQQGLVYLTDPSIRNKGFIQDKLDALNREILNIADAIKRSSFDDLAESDYRFHGIIVSACGNQLFDALYGLLRSFSIEEIKRGHQRYDDLKTITKKHRFILKTIKSGNTQKAIEIIRKHIRNIDMVLKHDYRPKQSA